MASLILLIVILAVFFYGAGKILEIMANHPIRLNPPVVRQEEEKPKAIDYSPESVVDWHDIEWAVEKRLPKEK